MNDSVICSRPTYPDQKSADAAAAWLREHRHHKNLKSHRCDRCGFFHVGDKR